MSLFRFTRTSQPQQAVEIDWSNPITRGLAFGHKGGQDTALVGAFVADVNVSSGFTQQGLATKFQDGGSSGSARYSVPSFSTSDLTIFWFGIQDSATNNYFDFVSLENAAGTTSYVVLESVSSGLASGGVGLYELVGGGGQEGAGGLVFGNKTPVKLTAVVKSKNPSIYFNGVGQSFAFKNLFTGADTVSSVRLSNRVGNTATRALAGRVNLALVWNRALSDAEIKSLSDNPWQIFQPTNRAIYPEAAGGSTYTLTADAASYSITGADASLIVNRKLIADAVNIPIAGADATLTHTPIGGPTYTLTADAGSYAITGNATGLAFNRVLTADAGSYSVAGQAVGLAFNRVLSAATANIPVAGQDVTLTYTNNGFTYTLSAETGAFNVTGQDARLVWSGEQTGYTNEIVLKPWYIRRNKKILLFSTAQEADAYIEAEEVAEQAIQEAQKTSRRARKRLRDKLIKVEPIQTVDVDQLTEAVQRFSIPVDLPKLIAQQDYERVMQILALAADMQDEEDVEMLLLM